MLLVYTFVFGVVFKARWAGTEEATADFAITLFAGLIVFNLFSETISRSPTLITSNINYVKKVVFPLEILPCVTLGSALFHALISLVVWLGCYVVVKGVPLSHALLTPLVILPLLIFTLGLSWLLASLGVFVRDISQIISIVVGLLLFLSPVFYPLSALPPLAQKLMRYNPLAQTIEQTRGVLLHGTSPDMTVYFIYLLMSVLVAWACFAWFQLSRRAFADVL